MMMLRLNPALKVCWQGCSDASPQQLLKKLSLQGFPEAILQGHPILQNGMAQEHGSLRTKLHSTVCMTKLLPRIVRA